MFVLDASISAAWIFPDEVNPLTESILERLRATSAVVPQIWPLEMVNLLLAAERRGRITPDRSQQALRFVGSLPISVVDSGAKADYLPLLLLARQHALSAYDASYLALAVARGIPIATQDRQLRAAAQSSGIPVLE